MLALPKQGHREAAGRPEAKALGDAAAPLGALGANVPATLRALVVCGWFGIRMRIGGQAIGAT